MIADPEGDAVRDETRVEALEAERDRLYGYAALVDELRSENVRLRKALERFLETTEGEDAVSGMALHGPITLARAALARIPEATKP